MSATSRSMQLCKVYMVSRNMTGGMNLATFVSLSLYNYASMDS